MNSTGLLIHVIMGELRRIMVVLIDKNRWMNLDTIWDEVGWIIANGLLNCCKGYIGVNKDRFK